jgi:hypothetical protein
VRSSSVKLEKHLGSQGERNGSASEESKAEETKEKKEGVEKATKKEEYGDIRVTSLKMISDLQVAVAAASSWGASDDAGPFCCSQPCGRHRSRVAQAARSAAADAQRWASSVIRPPPTRGPCLFPVRGALPL